MNRTSILTAAHDAVAQRGENYGKPSENFERIATLWSAYTMHPYSVEDVGIMMMLLKISRLMENPRHEDSWVDIAGYSAITAEAIAEMPDNLHLPVDQQNIESMTQGNHFEDQ